MNNDWKAACMSWQKAAMDKDKALDTFEQRCVVLEKSAAEWMWQCGERAKERDEWKAKYEKTRADQQLLVGQRFDLEKEVERLEKELVIVTQNRDSYKGEAKAQEDVVMELKQEVTAWKTSSEQCEKAARKWQAEAERWRVIACGNKVQQSRQECGCGKGGALSAWKNYDHAAEIESVRDELERTQNIIAEKERELERMEFRSGVRVPETAQKILDEIFDGIEEEGEVEEVKPTVVINIYL